MRFHLRLTALAEFGEAMHGELMTVATLAARSPMVTEAFGKGEGYTVRINERYPNAQLHGVYLVLTKTADDVHVMGCTSDEMRDVAAAYQREFGRKFPGYQPK